jgi:hypothetical integral membrane protein (TIGR02206 family)
VTPFSPAHLAAVALIVAVSIALPLAVRGIGSPRLARRLAIGLAGVILVQKAIDFSLAVFVYGVAPIQRLPLHICGVAAFLAVVALIGRDQRVVDILYYWGIAGGSQALLTPAMAVDFPHPLYVSFFIGHGLVILAVGHLMIVDRCRPSPRSLPRVIAVTLPYAAAIGAFNAVFDTNFLYIARKPDQPSLLDLMGPWPWYVLAMVGLGIVICGLLYLPFAIRDGLRRRAGPPPAGPAG